MSMEKGMKQTSKQRNIIRNRFNIERKTNKDAATMLNNHSDSFVSRSPCNASSLLQVLLRVFLYALLHNIREAMQWLALKLGVPISLQLPAPAHCNRLMPPSGRGPGVDEGIAISL